jgi:hypothetical protein
MWQVPNRWTYFHKTLYSGLLPTFVSTFRFWLKSASSDGPSTGRPRNVSACSSDVSHSAKNFSNKILAEDPEHVWWSTQLIKSSVFWDIMPCNPLIVNRRFGGTCRLQVQGRKISQIKTSMKQVASRAFNGPVGKTEHFITTAVRTSDPMHNLLSACMTILKVIKLKWRDASELRGYMYVS